MAVLEQVIDFFASRILTIVVIDRNDDSHWTTIARIENMLRSDENRIPSKIEKTVYELITEQSGKLARENKTQFKSREVTITTKVITYHNFYGQDTYEIAHVFILNPISHPYTE